jgi:acetoacetyl-CoA synthetase
VTSSQAIIDCLAVGQIIEGGVDERVILFVKLEEGESLSSDLETRLKREVRARRSPRHVPSRVSFGRPTCQPGRTHCLLPLATAQIIQVADIPYTLNGKRVEVPVKKVDPHISGTCLAKS